MDQKLRFIKLFLYSFNLFQINQKRTDSDEAYWTLKRRAGGTPERGDGLGRSARSRRVRAAPGFTTSEGGPRTERGERVKRLC